MTGTQTHWKQHAVPTDDREITTVTIFTVFQVSAVVGTILVLQRAITVVALLKGNIAYHDCTYCLSAPLNPSPLSTKLELQ